MQLLGVGYEQILEGVIVFHQRLQTHNQMLEDIIVEAVPLQVTNKSLQQIAILK